MEDDKPMIDHEMMETVPAQALRQLRHKYAILCHLCGHSLHAKDRCLLCGLSPKTDPNDLTEEDFHFPLPVE